MFCSAQNGCAVYIESLDQNHLFEFYQCSFDYNRDSTTSSVSRFTFTDYLFSQNCALDGNAIYYLSEEFNANTNDLALQNIIHNVGGEVHISIK